MSDTMDEGQADGDESTHSQQEDRPTGTIAVSTPLRTGEEWVMDMESEEDSSAVGEDGLLQVSITTADREGMVVDEGADTDSSRRDDENTGADTGTDVETGETADTGSSRTGEQLTIVARNRLFRDRYFTAINVDGTGTTDISPRGTLSMANDERYLWTHQWTDPNRQMNISSSFDTENFVCKGCDGNHRILDEHGRAVIVITDQLFIPAAPTAQGGDCMGIIRIEDATFTEMAMFLKDNIIRNLNSGSVVLIAAGTQLARCGVSAYCTDLAAVVNDLKRFMPKGCRITHCPFIFSRGTSDKPWLDAVRDLTNWLCRGATLEQGTDSLYLIDSHKKMLERIESNEVNERASLSTASRVVMPATLYNRASTIFQIGGGLMPDQIIGFSLEQQSEIVLSIVTELHDKTDVKLCAGIRYKYVEPVPVHASDAVPVAENNGTAVIVVGTGHASRTRVSAANSGNDATFIHLDKITAKTIADTKAKIQDLIKDWTVDKKRHTVLAFMAMDSQAFTSFNDSPDQDTAGTAVLEGEHFPGYMTTVPEATFRRMVEIAMPVLEVDPNVAAIVVMPLPKFFNGRGCCTDKSHVTNVRDPNFKSDMLKAMATGKNAINRAMVAGGHHLVRAINLAPKLTDTLSSTLSGDESAAVSNPGYLPLDQYSSVANEILEAAQQVRSKRAQYEGRNRDEVYSSNVDAYRADTRDRRARAAAGASNTAYGAGIHTRDRPYYTDNASDGRTRHLSDSSSARQTGRDNEERARHRSDPNATGRDAPNTGNTRQQGYAATSYHVTDPNVTANVDNYGSGSDRRLTPRFGARDIRYMTEEELEEDRRLQGERRVYGRRDSDRQAGSESGSGLTGTTSRRGRAGLYNLGRFTKKF